MTFNQDILYLIKKYQQSKENQMDVDSLFDEVMADRFIRLYINRLSEQEIDWVQKHLNNEKYVLLYTTQSIREKEKALLLNLVSQQVKSEEDSESYKTSKLLSIIAHMVLALGSIYLVISVVFHLVSSPINEANDIVRFFVPLVIVYLGFVLVDFFNNQIIKKQNLNTRFQVNLIKKKAYHSPYHLISVDDKEVWILTLNNNHINPQLASATKITDSESLEEFVQFFDKYKYLDNKTGYSPEKVMSWIYKD